MSETPVDMGMVSAPPSGSAAPPAASGAPPQQQQQPRVPDTRGHSPARDAREALPSPGERKITIGGMERPEQEVLDILASHAERQVAQAALPKDPNGYQIKLPDGFKAPEGMQFQIDANDPALAEFRALAHRRSLDQSAFEEALGVFASTKVAELQRTNAARETERNKLGAAVDQRIESVETWLKARVGDKANVLVSTLKQYPVAANVETFEALMRAFSSQGGASVTQSGREGQEDAGKIPGYENMSFAQKRVAQMNLRGGNR